MWEGGEVEGERLGTEPEGRACGVLCVVALCEDERIISERICERVQVFCAMGWKHVKALLPSHDSVTTFRLSAISAMKALLSR